MIIRIDNETDLTRFLSRYIGGGTGWLDVLNSLRWNGYVHGECLERLDALYDVMTGLVTVERPLQKAKWTRKKQAELDGKALDIIRDVFAGRYPLVAYTLTVAGGSRPGNVSSKVFYEIKPLSELATATAAADEEELAEKLEKEHEEIILKAHPDWRRELGIDKE